MTRKLQTIATPATPENRFLAFYQLQSTLPYLDRLTNYAVVMIVLCVLCLTALQSQFVQTSGIPTISFPSIASFSTSLPIIFHAISSSPSTDQSYGTENHSFLNDSSRVASAVDFDEYIEPLRQDVVRWLSYMKHSSAGMVTRRTACRELDAHGQTCVFDGLACLDTSTSKVTLVHDDDRMNGVSLRSDSWCTLRHQSADPKYLSSRHWPLLDDTDVPQRSCLSAKYESAETLARLAESENTTWVGRLSVVNLDYEENSHNNHLLKDIAWLLDSSLFEDSWQGELKASEKQGNMGIFYPYQKIYLPQTKVQFEKQTSRDVNRLVYALILRKDVRKLYQPSSPSAGGVSKTIPLFEAYPELESQLVFKKANESSVVCSARLLVGAKMGDLGHERVCRYMRSQSYDAYGINRPAVVRLGQIRYPQPPKRLMILDRHVTRKLGNAKEVVRELSERLSRHGVQVSYVSTKELVTAADFVRVYSSAGVIISPHGSHNMGLLWMQRFSALIEVMPVGYTDYAFNLLAGSCKVWHYELPSAVPKNMTEYYESKCGSRIPHMMSPCNDVKFKDVYINVEKAYQQVLFAFERLGYNMKSWLNDQI